MATGTVARSAAALAMARLDIADKVGFDPKRLFLGGDHLGPLTFAGMDEAQAMENAEELIRHYVSAGFTKIHIDTSMKVASDDPNTRLSDETIAKRGARLARVAQDTYHKLLESDPDAIAPVYIVGSEVPIPGGAVGAVDQGVQVTKVEDFKNTVATFEKAFREQGLDEAWDNVIGVVVQPGVEEKDSGCTEYDREKAKDLMASIQEFPNLVFEGHSTDYQTKIKLRMKRKYSFSDRCRYYMPTPAVEAAKERLISNLRTLGIPLNLLSQFMPIQYTKVREGLLVNDPVELVEDRIINTIDEYLYATHQKELV